jgi:hypothetical protein
MPHEGYIALWRKSLNSRIFQNDGLWKVWTWCLLKASYKKRWTSLKTGRGAVEIEILPGQFVFGRLSAAKELLMNPSTVWKRILKLKSFKTIKIKSNKQYSIISIIKWDVYQLENSKGDNQVTGKNGDKNAANPYQVDTSGSNPKHSVFVPSKVTGKSSGEDVENIDKTNKSFLKSNSESNMQVTCKEHASNTNNKGNKVNKVNKKAFLSDSIEYRLANYLLKFILNRNPNHKRPNLQTWAKYIDLMLRVDNKKSDDIKAVIRWCQNDTFWQNNILSTRKLKEKFDQLFLKMQEFNPGTGSRQTDANLKAAKAFLERNENE